MRLSLCSGLFLCFLSVAAFAQQPMGGMPEGMPPMSQMPQFQGMKMGVFNGTLVELTGQGKKAPVPGHTLAIVIFQNGQRVLMLDKKTDEQGRFQFKNIFMDPSYSYLIGTMWEGKVYEMKDLRLQEGEKERQIEFSVGEGSPYWVTDEGAPAQEERPKAMEERPSPQGPSDLMRAAGSQPVNPEGTFSVGTFWKYPYQKIAVVLTVIVALAGLYHFAQPGRRD